jgi:hypothetical protein
MALYRSGDKAGARRALAEAEANALVHVPGIDRGGWPHDCLTAHMLCREAKAVITGKKAKQRR